MIPSKCLTSFIVLAMSVLLVLGQPNPQSKKAAPAPAPAPKSAPAPAPKSSPASKPAQQQAKPKDPKSQPNSAKTNSKPPGPPPASQPPTPSKNELQKQADEAKRKDHNSPAAKQLEKEAKDYDEKHGPYQMQESKHPGLGDGYKFDPKTGKLAQSTYANEQRIQDRYGLTENKFFDAWDGHMPRADLHKELGERDRIRYNQGEPGSSKDAVNGNREKEKKALESANRLLGDSGNHYPLPEMLPENPRG